MTIQHAKHGAVWVSLERLLSLVEGQLVQPPLLHGGAVVPGAPSRCRRHGHDLLADVGQARAQEVHRLVLVRSRRGQLGRLGLRQALVPGNVLHEWQRRGCTRGEGRARREKEGGGGGLCSAARGKEALQCGRCPGRLLRFKTRGMPSVAFVRRTCRRECCIVSQPREKLLLASLQIVNTVTRTSSTGKKGMSPKSGGL